MSYILMKFYERPKLVVGFVLNASFLEKPQSLSDDDRISTADDKAVFCS